MEKALEFLTKLKKSRDFDGNLEYSLNEAIVELEEANNTHGKTLIMLNNANIRIAELEEAMKPKTCEWCFYDDKDGVLHVECAFCLRNSNDNFEPKEQ